MNGISARYRFYVCAIRSTAWIGFVLYLGLLSIPTWSDIVTLKDGTTLRCEVADKKQMQDPAARFLEIHIGQSVIWLNKTAVDRIEAAPSKDAPTPEMEELVKRLMDEGILVSPDDELTSPDALQPPVRDQIIPIRVKEIRGWAYLYENDKAKEEGNRTLVAANSEIPFNQLLIVSPNTRMTLDIPNLGELGLEAGTQIRFEEMSRNRSRRSFAMNIRLDQGACWFRIQTGDRVIFTVNSVRSIPQNVLLYLKTAGKTGAVDITYLKGSGDLKFSRNRIIEAPYSVNQGQVLHLDPGINRLVVDSDSHAETLQQRISSWSDWQPEPLAFDLNRIIPPLQTFPSFRALPALHPFTLPIDQSLIMPPETRSMGEIMETYRKALERYRLETGKYPTFDQGLDALTQKMDVPGWHGPYIPLDLPRRDAWGNPYVYDLYTEKGKQWIDIRSNGPNAKDDKGLGDDFR